MKKLLAFLLCVAVLFSMTACIGQSEKEDDEEKTASKNQNLETPDNEKEPENTEPEETQPITAYFAEEEEADYIYCQDGAEDGVGIGITANAEMTLVFGSLIWETETYEFSQVLAIYEMTAAEQFFAKVSFPGDMTAYGVAVTDGAGNTHYYALFMSGEDGSLICREFEPGLYPDTEREYDFYHDSFCYHIPVVNIPGVNAGKINQQMYELHYAEYWEDVSNDLCFLLGINYTVAQKGDVVSVAVCHNCDCDLNAFFIYNFSASTGAPVSDEVLYSLYGMTQEDAYDVIYNALSSYWDRMKEKMPADIWAECEEPMEFTLQDSNIRRCKPFIHTDGRLCFVGHIGSFAGAAKYTYQFDDEGNIWVPYCKEYHP